MTIYLDLQRAMELIDAAIERKGEDYVYTRSAWGCMYVDYTSTFDDEGNERRICRSGCIVGDALIAPFGVDLDALSHKGVNEMDVYDFLGWLRDYGHIEGYADSAEEYLNRIQVKQDRGATWGDARREAKEELNY